MGDGGGEGEDEVQFLRTVRFVGRLWGEFWLSSPRVSGDWRFVPHHLLDYGELAGFGTTDGARGEPQMPSPDMRASGSPREHPLLPSWKQALEEGRSNSWA